MNTVETMHLIHQLRRDGAKRARYEAAQDVLHRFYWRHQHTNHGLAYLAITKAVWLNDLLTEPYENPNGRHNY